ncbi:laccase domain-containing protein, partial [Plasticicumulans sp.]|uniref:laccase domain-containing protein n=1 Tax=Plasticicumulans sp. TaxID=2307179 RepID=UPI00393A4867
GPCIGPRRFEVGADVLEAFGVAPGGEDGSAFRPCPAPGGDTRWLADLPRLARERLARAGVRQIGGGHWCTVEDAQRFYSYRRDRVTGRQAAAVWIRG